MRPQSAPTELANLAQQLAALTGEPLEIAIRRALEERLRHRLAVRAQAVALARDLALIGEPVVCSEPVMAAA